MHDQRTDNSISHPSSKLCNIPWSTTHPRSVLLVRMVVVEKHCIRVGARTRRLRRSINHAQLLHRLFPFKVCVEVRVKQCIRCRYPPYRWKLQYLMQQVDCVCRDLALHLLVQLLEPFLHNFLLCQPGLNRITHQVVWGQHFLQFHFWRVTNLIHNHFCESFWITYVE